MRFQMEQEARKKMNELIEDDESEEIPDEEVAETCGIVRSHGMRERYKHEALGFNYRMTDIHAAIGLVDHPQSHPHATDALPLREVEVGMVLMPRLLAAPRRLNHRHVLLRCV